MGFLLRKVGFDDIYIDMAYRFREFKWMDNREGFDYPVDVYNDSVFLGTLICKNDGYQIYSVSGPRISVKIKEGPRNKFKTKEDAASMLHRVWKLERKS